MPLKPCERCDDSGYIEIVSGGFWTGENMRFRHEICDCPCGEDVRLEANRAQPIAGKVKQ